MTDQPVTDRLDGKSALVTGGGGGFGKACAVLLARDGAAVTLMGRNARTLAAARESILAKAPEAQVAIHAGDSTDESDVKAAVNATIALLAGPRASWITGQSFAVDGGNELRGAPAA